MKAEVVESHDVQLTEHRCHAQPHMANDVNCVLEHTIQALAVRQN